MYLSNQSRSADLDIDGETLRAVFGQCAAKKIARRFDIAISTAKLWLGAGAPTSRLRTIAAELDAELARQTDKIADLRRRIRAGLAAAEGQRIESGENVSASGAGDAALPVGRGTGADQQAARRGDPGRQ